MTSPIWAAPSNGPTLFAAALTPVPNDGSCRNFPTLVVAGTAGAAFAAAISDTDGPEATTASGLITPVVGLNPVAICETEGWAMLVPAPGIAPVPKEDVPGVVPPAEAPPSVGGVVSSEPGPGDGELPPPGAAGAPPAPMPAPPRAPAPAGNST